jgi:hypothetical protein
VELEVLIQAVVAAGLVTMLQVHEVVLELLLLDIRLDLQHNDILKTGGF